MCDHSWLIVVTGIIKMVSKIWINHRVTIITPMLMYLLIFQLYWEDFKFPFPIECTPSYFPNRWSLYCHLDFQIQVTEKCKSKWQRNIVYYYITIFNIVSTAMCTPRSVEKGRKGAQVRLQRTGWGFFCQSAAGSSGSGTTTLIVPMPPLSSGASSFLDISSPPRH